MGITDEEQQRRVEAFRQARHSTEMEGERTSEAARADQDAFAAGQITEEELHRRIKDRHGVL